MTIPRYRRRTVSARDLQIKVVKNINLLDRPLFIPSRTRVEQDVYNDQNGYEISCPTGLPVSKDIDLLNLLLHKTQATRGLLTVEFDSMSDLLQELGYSVGEKNYAAVRQSLECWGQTQICFQQESLYIGRGRYGGLPRTHILQVSHPHNGLRIEFNRHFLDLNNSSSYVMKFPLKLMPKFTPFSKRLFEILRKNEKNFEQELQWKISLDKLRRKMPIINGLSNAKFVYQVKDSCNEINEKMHRYGMRHGYAVERGGRRYQIFIFNKGLMERRTARDTIRTEGLLFRTS